MFKFWWILNIYLQLSLAYSSYEGWHPGMYHPHMQHMQSRPFNYLPKVYIGSFDDDIVILSTTEQSTRHGDYYWSNINFDKKRMLWEVSNENCDLSWDYPKKLVLRDPSSIPAIPKNLFKYISIRGFVMKNLGLKSVSTEDFKYAYFLESIDLSNNSLTELPSFLFSYSPAISSIDLSNNDIEHIEENAFEKDPSIKPFETFPYNCRDKHDRLIKKEDSSYLSIETIVLDNNRLHFVEAKWFAPLQNLIRVSLAFNKFQEIDATTVFANNMKLNNVDLRNNQLRDITKLKFQNLIDIIDLSNNPVETPSDLYASSFQTYMRNVRNSDTTLTISSNVSILVASSNSISSIISESESGENRLVLLMLDDNKMTSISKLTAFRYLEVLSLSKNLLTTFEAEVFKQLPLLRQLDLSYNKLKHFELIINMPNLNELNLAGNGLTTLGTNIRNMAPQIVGIGLKDNDWNCEHLTTIMLLIHSDGITISINGTTNTPDEYKQIKYDGSVKGVNCFNDVDSTTTLPYEMAAIANDAFKKDIHQLLDEKLSKLQDRLIEMIQKLGKQ